MNVYAQQNDNLDAMIYRTFGTSYGGLLEQTLLLNPTLTAYATLPLGTPVILPDSASSNAVKTDSIQLWS
ncbi:tail protein X [Lonepinella sp. BR2919]|uniref:tail protein X n=1 Tax=unclassified Lonepinella TaxID=2642006 RepID=UPI003F6DEE01